MVSFLFLSTNGVQKIAPWSIPLRWIHTWVRARVWVRVRLGGIWSGGIHSGELTKGNFRSTLQTTSKSLDLNWSSYDNIIILGDFNPKIGENSMKTFCERYSLSSLIKAVTLLQVPAAYTLFQQIHLTVFKILVWWRLVWFP